MDQLPDPLLFCFMYNSQFLNIQDPVYIEYHNEFILHFNEPFDKFRIVFNSHVGKKLP